jgi:hypothetical protein
MDQSSQNSKDHIDDLAKSVNSEGLSQKKPFRGKTSLLIKVDKGPDAN